MNIHGDVCFSTEMITLGSERPHGPGWHGLLELNDVLERFKFSFVKSVVSNVIVLLFNTI